MIKPFIYLITFRKSTHEGIVQHQIAGLRSSMHAGHLTTELFREFQEQNPTAFDFNVTVKEISKKDWLIQIALTKQFIKHEE